MDKSSKLSFLFLTSVRLLWASDLFYFYDGIFIVEKIEINLIIIDEFWFSIIILYIKFYFNLIFINYQYNYWYNIVFLCLYIVYININIFITLNVYNWITIKISRV